MSSLTNIEKQKLERELRMVSGCVLDFSDRTFEEFFREVVGVEIYDPRFGLSSGSKANRMRAFWQVATEQQILTLFDGLKEGWDIYSRKPIPSSAIALLDQIRNRLWGAATSSDSRSRRRFEDLRFTVALSFPGTHRSYVSAVAQNLKISLGDDEVFYDLDYQAHLARPNLDTLLQKIYTERPALVVVFLASDYVVSDWCGLEWRAVRDIIKSKNWEQVMFVRFDQTPVEGTFGIDGYIDASSLSPEDTAAFILDRVKDGARKEVLHLAIIDAAVAYSIYAASLINYAIDLKNGGNVTDCETQTGQLASKLAKAMEKCYVTVPIPTHFDTLEDAMVCLTQSPVITSSCAALEGRHSKYEGEFFGFCSIIGAVVVAQGVSSASIHQARATGKAIGLPDKVVEACVSQLDFQPLRDFIKGNQSPPNTYEAPRCQ